MLAALARALGMASGLLLGACFSESGPSPCPVGTMGCHCDAGACDPDLECAGSYCVLADCEPGSEFCECADGGCDAGLECVDGAVCLQPNFGSGDGGGDDAANDAADDAPPSTSGMTTPADDGTNDSGPDDGANEATDAGTVGGECDPACGTCFECVGGQCMVTPGAACEGPSLQCSTYTFGLSDGQCRVLAEAVVEATCSEGGKCLGASFDACPNLPGDVLHTCSIPCLTISSGCSPGLPAAEVELADFCEVDGPTLSCGSSCNRMSYEAETSTCVDGECVLLNASSCNGYGCNGSFCANTCDEFFLVCEPGYSCVDGDCVP